MGGINSLAYSNTTWSKIVKTGFEIDGLGVDFSKSFTKLIGNGRGTIFWEDVWIKDNALKDTYKRLVRLEANVNVAVSDRFIWDGHRCSSNWVWSRAVTGRTKVGVLVWRARRGRLAVLFELDKRVVDLNSILCPLCDDAVETVSHALFACKLVREIWDKVLKWWGMDSTQHNIDNILCGSSYLPCSSVGEKIWQAMVWTSVYLIWKNRNQKVFKGLCWFSPVALNDIQVKSYEWIAKRNKTTSIEWLDWLQNPKLLVL
ncbi:uncharacterized protein [Rutidosis leptorrhynchoides]|uniref:uncharacterized protein n=1 Tax=Rutidosis leptorrhynchoides TaxID=125765 RepID=UPI003A98D8D9